MKLQDEALVRIENLSRVYRAADVETRALVDVSLNIGEGEFVAVRGPSGSGKSTLLSLIGTLETPSQGRYQFAGESVFDFTNKKLARFRSHKLGFVFQSFNLIETVTVLENVVLALRCAGGYHPKAMRKVAMETLDQVGMSHRLNHFPYQLSGGQQQRVAIARALVNQPKLILADEPTGNLDSKNSENIMQILKEQNRQGTTICMVTHDPDVSQWASRVITMEDGRMVPEVERKREEA